MNIVERAIDGVDPAVSARLRAIKLWWQDDDIRKLIKQNVSSGSIALDVGANRGAYTWVLSSAVGSSGRVHAIEPFPLNAAKLTILARRRKNVSVHAVAASDRNGNADLYVPTYHGHTLDPLATLSEPNNVSTRSIAVPLCPIDSILPLASQHVSFVKFDIEGHENEALEGASRLLQTDRPTVVIEIEQRHRREPVDSIFRWFDHIDYRGYFFSPAGVRPIEDFAVYEHQTALVGREFIPYSTPPGYVSDFLFVPHEIDHIQHRDGGGSRRSPTC
jgi:FkbM family methyltransferase